MHWFLPFFPVFVLFHHQALTMFNIVAWGRCPSLERLRLHQCSAHKISQLMFCAYWNYGECQWRGLHNQLLFFTLLGLFCLQRWLNDQTFVPGKSRHFHVLLNMGNHCYVNVKSIEAGSGSNVRFEYDVDENCLFLQPFKPFLYAHANSLTWSPYIFLFHVLKVNTYCSRPAKDTGPGRCPLWIPCPSTSKYTLKGESSVDCLLPLPTPPPPSPPFRKVNPFAPGNFAEKRFLKLVEQFSGHCRAKKS